MFHRHRQGSTPFGVGQDIGRRVGTQVAMRASPPVLGRWVGTQVASAASPPAHLQGERAHGAPGAQLMIYDCYRRPGGVRLLTRPFMNKLINQFGGRPEGIRLNPAACARVHFGARAHSMSVFLLAVFQGILENTDPFSICHSEKSTTQCAHHKVSNHGERSRPFHGRQQRGSFGPGPTWRSASASRHGS